MFFVPLIVTLIAEELVSLLWGFRTWKDVLTVLWINVLTNLSVTGLRLLFNQLLPTPTERAVIAVMLELAVLFSEWLLYRRFMSSSRHSFLFSLSMNAASYGLGLLYPLMLQLLYT